MKNLLLCSSLMILTPIAQADTFLGIYAGAGVWQADHDGEIGANSIGLDQLGLEDENNNFFFVALEHPIPLLPNIKLHYTELSSNSSAVVNQGFRLEQINFPAGSDIDTSLDLSHTDATFYYEILDNIVSLDIGLTARMYDGEVSVDSSVLSEQVDLSGTIPMAYGKAQIDLPLTGWALGADVNWISAGGNTMTDATARISYYTDLTPLFEVGLEAGVRYLTLDTDELDDLDTDIELTGPYIAVIAHF